LQNALEQSVDALEHGDLQTLGEVFHSIKGILLNVGLANLAEQARELEQAVKHGGSMADIASKHEMLSASMQAIISKLDS
jgi:HPt (histidine-containing phosphotransfer) domain-containing protein